MKIYVEDRRVLVQWGERGTVTVLSENGVLTEQLREPNSRPVYDDLPE